LFGRSGVFGLAWRGMVYLSKTSAGKSNFFIRSSRAYDKNKRLFAMRLDGVRIAA